MSLDDIYQEARWRMDDIETGSAHLMPSPEKVQIANQLLSDRQMAQLYPTKLHAIAVRR